MSARETLDRYFDALRGQDWPALADCLAADVDRVGPYLDRVTGRAAYVAFLSRVIPTLENYSLSVTRVHEVEARSVWVELTERLDVGGVSTEFPEALFFGFDDEGRIEKVSVYIKQPPKEGQ